MRYDRGSASRGTVLSVTNGCQLRGRSPKVRRLSRLGAHTNLEWARRVYVGFTIAVIEWEFMDSRQADQASTESRGTHTRGSMSVRGASMRGTEHPYVRTLCACSPTPLNYRSGQRVSSGRDGRVGGMVEMARSQCGASICSLCVGVNWGGVSVMWCRRQWYRPGTVFGPSRGRRRLYLERTWVPSVRVGVTRRRRATSHGGSRRGYTRTMGTRGYRGVSRDCGDVCSGGESRTITLLVRRRASAMGLEVTVVRRVSSAITLRAAVRAASVPPAHAVFPCLEYGAIRVVRSKLGFEQGEGIRERGRTPSEAMFG